MDLLVVQQVVGAKGVPRGEVENSGLCRARTEVEDGEFIRVQHLAQQAWTPAPECSLHAGHMQQVASKPDHPHDPRLAQAEITRLEKQKKIL
jgi:hypothetical protein